MDRTIVPRAGISAPGQPSESHTESLAPYAGLAENASDIIFRYRYKPTRGFEYVNPAVTAITGYTPEEYYADADLGRVIVHPDDRPRIVDVISQPTSVNAPITIRLIRKDGGTVWAEYRMIPVLDDAGELAAVEGIVRDMTQHVLTQQILERVVSERTQEIERRREVAESLRATLAVLNSDRSIAEILDHIVGQAIALLRAGAAAVYQLDSTAQVLRIRAARGLDDDYVASMEIPVGKGPVGEAVVYRRPVPVSNVAEKLRGVSDQMDPRIRSLLARLTARCRALIAVPLIVKDDVYGGLVVYYGWSRDFTAEDISLAVALGDQAALAIENARLRDHLQEAAATAARDRLARDLHDSVTQTLFSISLIAGVLPQLWERAPDEAQARLEELRQLARGALAEMRTLLLELRPAALLEMELGELLRHLVDAAAGRSRLPVSLMLNGGGRLPADVQITLYRIAQEAVNNVTKHAKANHCTVAVEWSPDRVRLNISDDGRGFDAAHVSQTRLGLAIMRERADAIGAALIVRSDIGRGTAVEVAWNAKATAGV